MFNPRPYWLCDVCGGWMDNGLWCCWYVMLWECSFLCWVTGSGNGCTALGAGVGIGTGVSLGIGVGRTTLGFLLIPGLHCLTLGLGMGGMVLVGSPLSIGCV